MPACRRAAASSCPGCPGLLHLIAGHAEARSVLQVMVSQFAAAVQLLWHELELHQQSEPQRGTDPVTGELWILPGPDTPASITGCRHSAQLSQDHPKPHSFTRCPLPHKA